MLGADAVGGGAIFFNESSPVSYGSTVVASAEPNPGEFFVTWSGAASGTNSPTTLVVTNSNPTVYALFSALPAGKYSLSVAINGPGTVGINPRRNYYGPGDSITLTASTTNAGARFVNWSQGAAGTANPLAVVVASNTIIRANFAGPAPVLSLAMAGQQLTLSWPQVDSLYQLESATDLESPQNWTPITNAPANMNGQFTLTLPVSGRGQFFRLKALP